MKFSAHPLNRQFAWQPRRVPLRAITEEQARDYETLGYFVMKQAFDPDTIKTTTAEIDRIEQQAEMVLRSLHGGKGFIARASEITFTTHLVKKSPVLRDFCKSRLFADVGHDLIGPDVRLYWDQAIYKKPNTTAPFPWHQDNGYTFVDPQQYVTCWVALTDADEDNGCLWVLPRVHRQGTLLHKLTDLGYICFDAMPEGAIALPVKAGDMAVFAATTPHFTGANLTQWTRKAYIMQYVPDGACAITVDDTGGSTRRIANAADRQFPVLVDGRYPAE